MLLPIRHEEAMPLELEAVFGLGGGEGKWGQIRIFVGAES